MVSEQTRLRYYAKFGLQEKLWEYIPNANINLKMIDVDLVTSREYLNKARRALVDAGRLGFEGQDLTTYQKEYEKAEKLYSKLEKELKKTGRLKMKGGGN